MCRCFRQAKTFADLRQNPRAIERITPARAYLPLRSFLTAVNSAESVFASATVATGGKPATDISRGESYEFGSLVRIVFSEPSLNFDRGRYTELTAGLKELLERDPEESIRGELRVTPCDFPEQRRRGFCLGIHLGARGDSAKQAELTVGIRFGAGAAGASIPSSRLGQQIGA